jgi:hypothetical protein
MTGYAGACHRAAPCADPLGSNPPTSYELAWISGSCVSTTKIHPRVAHPGIQAPLKTSRAAVVCAGFRVMHPCEQPGRHRSPEK